MNSLLIDALDRLRHSVESAGLRWIEPHACGVDFLEWFGLQSPEPARFGMGCDYSSRENSFVESRYIYAFVTERTAPQTTLVTDADIFEGYKRYLKLNLYSPIS